MLNFENKSIVRNLQADINTDYDMLMVECVLLSDSDLLPGTDTAKLSVKQAKLEFHSRVKEWYDKIISTACDKSFNSHLPLPPLLDGRSVRTHRSTSSSVISRRRKESQVKLKLALYAKEIEEERSRQQESDKQALEEAVLKAESAQREVEKLREAIRRENVKREVAWDTKLTMVEAKAWDEVSGLDDYSASAYHHKVGLNTREVINGGSKEFVVLPGDEMDVPEGKPDGRTKKPFFPSNKFSVSYGKSEDPSVGQEVQTTHVDKWPTKASKNTELMPSECSQWSALRSCQIA